MNTKLDTKANAVDVYTKTEVNGLVSNINSGVNTLRDSVKANITAIGTKADTADVYTRTEIDNAHFVNNTNCSAINFCDWVDSVKQLATDMRGFQHDVNNLKDSINDLNAKIDALENTIRILAGYQKVLDL